MADAKTTVVMKEDDAEKIVDRMRNDPNSGAPENYNWFERHGARAIADNFNVATEKKSWIPGIGGFLASSNRESLKAAREAAYAADDNFEATAKRMVQIANAHAGETDEEKEKRLKAEAEKHLPSLTEGLGRSGLFAMLFGGLGLLGGKMLGGGGGLFAMLGAASAIGYTVYQNYEKREEAKKPLVELADQVLERQKELEQEQLRQKEGKEKETPSTGAMLSAEAIAATKAAVAGSVRSRVVVADPEASTTVVARNNDINKSPAGRTT